MKKAISLLLSVIIAFSCASVAFAGNGVSYNITNPYANVTSYLGIKNSHYKTNLHTHSTVSDASVDYADMIKAYYDNGFDILAMTDHGVLGKEWNEEPTHLPVFLYQYIIGNKVTKLTDEEYSGITSGTYASSTRNSNRGMQCVADGIELNNLTITKAHVNGYFCDFDAYGAGEENGHEYAVSHVDEAGGISVINHPGDWIESKYNEDAARDPENVSYYGDILNEYKSCLGIEIYNNKDSITRHDRILWDEILQYVIPNGERNVWGFGNSDAHELEEIETSYMDFIMPSYSIANVKTCMENGEFFAVCRCPYELPWDFVAEGNYPTVTSIKVDDFNDTITVTAKDADSITWCAYRNTLQVDTVKNLKGEVISTIKLREHSDDITCYVRFYVTGKGGITASNAFVCDDGDMARFVTKSDESTVSKILDDTFFAFKSTIFYVLIQEAVRAIVKELS